MSESVLVIGGTGLIGNALVRDWDGRGARVAAATCHRAATRHFRRLDIRDAGAVRALLAELRPGLVALPAANPHVDYIEAHPEETRQVNVEGSLNVLRACRETGARLIFFSTDYVFDGLKGEYSEEDPPTPLSEYGRQKAEVEEAVLGDDPRHLVIRTAGAFGWQWEPKNFVLQVRAHLGEGRVMKVAEDLSYNPTYAENLADVTADLAASGRGGLFHVVGADRIGRFDFAREAARAFGLDAGLLKPVSSKEFNPPAPRPKQSSLRTDKVRAAVSTPLWGVRRSLEHMASSEEAWRRYAAERLPAAAAKGR